MLTRLITTLMLSSMLILAGGCGQNPPNPGPTPLPETLIPSEAIPTTQPVRLTTTPVPSTVAPTAKVEEFALIKLKTLPEEDCTAAGLPALACQGVTTNAAWTPVIREFDGIQMVLVPAGCFKMGYEDNLPEERPVHTICFEQPFWIDLTETTAAQFAQFLNDQEELPGSYDRWLNQTDPPWRLSPHIQLALENGTWKPLQNKENQPLEYITWIGASEYCAWRGARLPTEAEWEYAARGPESWLYPWGNEYDSGKLQRSEFQMPDVGSLPQGASWVGALDLSGSLYEWTNSLYRPYPYDPNDGREASLEEDPGNRVFRGCPWYHSEDNLYGPMHDNVSATARHDNSPDTGLWYFGFRCARPLDPN